MDIRDFVSVAHMDSTNRLEASISFVRLTHDFNICNCMCVLR
jgi:hypothetical protein